MRMRTALSSRRRTWRSVRRLWADPHVRLLLGVAGVAASAVPVNRDGVGRREAGVFRAVNDLPDSLFVPAWPVMQLGTLGAAPALAVAAHLAGDEVLARRLVMAGPATWALSKAVKRRVQRGRPHALLEHVHTRGQPATGLGYLSGHAGVAVVIGLAVLRHSRRRSRVVALAAMPIVGLSRIYVGAHLPLDVVGGAALGLAVDAAVEIWQA